MKLIVLSLLLLLSNILASAQPEAELVLVNARIRTLSQKPPTAEAMAIANGKIIAIGSNATVRKLSRPETKVIDARGRLVIPGFNDSHVHLTGIGNLFSHLDTRGMTSRESILNEISRFAEFLPKGRWIMAGGFDPAKLDPAGAISLDLLDKASGGHPLLMFTEGGKSIVANSAAMKIAGVDNTTKDPTDGTIVRNLKGDPTGVFTGNASQLIRKHVPTDHGRNWFEIVETASSYAASLGVTTMQDVHSDNLVDTLSELDRKGRLKSRIYECVGIDAWKTAFRSSNGLVRSGCVKGVAFGIDEEVEELNENIANADKAGLQVMIHAIGAKAIRNTLNSFDRAIQSNGKRDRRFRIEHAARADPADIPSFLRSKVIASMQPHLFYSGPEYGDNYRSMLKDGVIMAFGSDASMTDLNPLLGISAAVNSGSRSLTVEEAVRAYTSTAAFAEFEDDRKGVLAVGKAADFVILSEDIFEIDPKRISAVKVLMTVVDGKVVFSIL